MKYVLCDANIEFNMENSWKYEKKKNWIKKQTIFICTYKYIYIYVESGKICERESEILNSVDLRDSTYNNMCGLLNRDYIILNAPGIAFFFLPTFYWNKCVVSSMLMINEIKQ